MKELVMSKEIDLLRIPNGEDLWGIAIPCSGSVNKDGLAILDHPEARNASRVLKINRKLGEYISKWGNRVFYLGTFSNPEGGKFCLFSFPVKHSYKASSDLTLITKSCEDLVALCDKRGVKRCLLPMFADDLGINFFINTTRELLNLELDDRFFMLHRAN